MPTLKHNRGFKQHKLTVPTGPTLASETITQASSWHPRRLFAGATSLALVLSLLAPLGATAAAGASADLDQCANGPIASPTTCTGAAWQNGNLNANQAHYIEGQSVPYRMKITGLTNGAHTLVIGYDTKRSSKYTIDYLTSYDRTESTADPCSGFSPCVAGTPGAIPVPSNAGTTTAGMPANSFNAIPASDRMISIFNGNITGVTYASQDSLAGADASTQVSIAFTSSQPNVVVAWGGHIASRLDWGVGNSAGNVNGSSYHMRLISLDGAGGNQDRSLSAAAVVFGNLTVIKHVINNNNGTAVAADFDITVTGNSPNPSNFPGLENGTSVLIGTGAYNVTEGAHNGYGVTYSAGCTGTIVANTSVTCTITNDDDAPPATTGTLTLNKTVTNDNGGNAVANDFQAKIDGNNVPWGQAQTVNGGAHLASETNQTGYTAGSWGGDCDAQGNVTVGVGENKTCTITNDDQAAHLILNKVVSNNNGGNAGINDFGLTVDGNAVTSGTNTAVNANTPIAINEAGLVGYHFVSITGDAKCPAVLGGTVTLDEGETVTCTINNDDNAPTNGTLTVTKVVITDNGGTAVVSDFPLFIGATSVTSGVGNSLPAGNYVVSETNQTGYTGTISGDCDAQGNVSLAAGDNKTCTITNDDQAATLTVIKQVVNNSGTGNSVEGDFQMHVKQSGADVTGSPVAGSTVGSTFTLNAGVYDVSETGPGGYAASFSGNCTSTGSVTLTLGQNATCTITNDDIARPQPTDVDMSIDKIVSDSSPNVNDQVTYTVTVDNAGPADATGVTVTDVLPAGVTYVSHNTATGTFDSNTGIWTIGNVAVSDPVMTLEIVVKIDVGTNGQTIVNTGTVDSTENDNNPSNNTDDATLIVNRPRSGGGGGGGGSSTPQGQVLGESTSIPFQPTPQVLAELPRTGLPLDAVALLLTLAGLSAIPTFRRKQA